MKHILAFLGMLGFLFSSCERVGPYNRSVEDYFESWSGVWSIDQIEYVDKNTTTTYASNPPTLTFFSCVEVTQRDGGMCNISLTDQAGQVNDFFAIGQFTDEANNEGELRIEFSPNTETGSNFMDSLLITGEFTCQQFSDGTAVLEGGRIPNLGPGDPFFSSHLRITLSKP